MHWNSHSEIEGLHAFLSPSKYHWLNYSEDKLRDTYSRQQATIRGTQLHEYAATAIRLKRRQPKNNDTVNMYINDAIGYRMRAEQPLYYSPNCFGTADSISYMEKHGERFLRIHDLKTGDIPAHMWQLEIYAAIFLLEYGLELGIRGPEDISIELRIYQSGEVLVEEPEAEAIRAIMDKIIESDKVIETMNKED